MTPRVVVAVTRATGQSSRPPLPHGKGKSVDVSLTLPRDPTAAGIARREIARRVGESLGDRLGDLELVVSELVNNAFLHGRGEIRLALRLDGGRVSGDVLDGGDGFPPTVSEHRPDEAGGFGLGLVRSLTSRWGVREGASHVWFEMDLAAEVTPSGGGTGATGQARRAPPARAPR
jgi:anti-sigma regulatory factor (Ser/Thr protein kinase)